MTTLQTLLRLCLALGLLCSVAPAARADDDPDTEVAKRLFKEGSDLYVAGDYQKALEAFQKARLARPLPAFDFNIARCHDRLGRWSDALADYERYVANTTDNTDVDEAKQRIPVLRDRIKLAADRANAEEHYKRAVTSYNVAAYVAAIDEFKQANAIAPDPLFLYNIAQSYRLAQNPDSAITYYQRFLSADPGTPLKPSVEGRLAELRAAAPNKAKSPDPKTETETKTEQKTEAKPESKPEPKAIAPKPVVLIKTQDSNAASQRLKPVQELIKAHRAGFRACFDAWSEKHRNIPGQVTLSFYLDPDGVLNQVSAEPKGFDGPEVAACIVSFAKTLTYPAAPNAKYTRFNYPFDFKPN